MKDLRELIKLVSTRSQSPLPLLGKREMKPGKENTLYEKIKSGEYTTDEQAALDLYGSTPADAKYRVLKNRLEQKLLNQLFFIDFGASGVKKSHKYEMECHDLLHQARVLINTGFNSLSEKLLIKTLRKAKETEFTSVILSCLELLLDIYSTNSNESAFLRVEQQILHYHTLAGYEREAEIIYFKARLHERHSTYVRQNYFPQLETDLSRLEVLWQQTGSFNIFDYYYHLYVFKQESNGDFEEILSFINRTELLLKHNKINNKRFDHRFTQYMCVLALLMLKEYNKGLQLASIYISSFAPSSSNWFAFMENYFSLAVHAQKYDLAVSLLHTVENNPFITKLRKASQEKWILNSTYLSFICPDIYPYKYKNFQAFIATVPGYTKDKQGFNISVLMIEFLYCLKLNQREELVYFAENVKKYMEYHLKAYANSRAVTFLRLILLLIKYELIIDKCSIKVKALYQNLLDAPMSADSQAEIEIVPFEHLWELILQMLNDSTTADAIKTKKRINKHTLA